MKDGRHGTFRQGHRDQLRDIHPAGKPRVKALPGMAEKITGPKLTSPAEGRVNLRAAS
jgi:ferritin-like metal-binding protein YciE